ncbi:MAG: PAS domain S-box protein, partial [Desulfobaccales bacterium]
LIQSYREQGVKRFFREVELEGAVFAESIHVVEEFMMLRLFAVDITERKRAGETLGKSEQKYRLLVNQIPAVLFKGYADASIDFFDRKVEELTGYPKEDFDSRTLKWTDLVVAEDQKDWKSKFLEALRTNRNFMQEYQIRRKDGTLRWIQGRSQIFCDEAGKVDYVSGILFDITEQRRTEEALRESEEKYRGLIETTSTGYVIVDTEGKVLDANPEYVRLTGHKELKEIMGRSVIEWTAQQDRGKNADAQEQCQKTGVVKHLELTYAGGDGHSIPVEINATAIRTSEGVKRIALVRDISERQRVEDERAKLEAHLVQAQKMEAIGTLAGGIAHDFNNILTAILGNIGLGMLDQTLGDQGRQRLAAADNACQQAQRLARQLLTFAKGGAPIKELVSLETWWLKLHPWPAGAPRFATNAPLAKI